MGLDERKRRIVRIVGEKQLDSGQHVSGRFIRRTLRDLDPEQVDRVLAACVPDRLRRTGSAPNDTYEVTAAGIEHIGPAASRVAVFVEGALAFLRRKETDDPDFRDYRWSELAVAADLDPKADYNFAVGAIMMAGLAGAGTRAPGAPDFHYEVPRDIELVLRCRHFDELVQLRTRRRGEPTEGGPVLMESDDAFIPKAFVSYSWDSDEHKDWVKDLSARLRASGVEVILDQWHVSPGDQLPEFMERSIRECDFVLMICTPGYKARADGRTGGVGYEGHVITAAVYNGGAQRKFIPIWREGDWASASPSWLAGKVRIDLRDPCRDEELEPLLQHLHGEREEAPPVIPRQKKAHPKPTMPAAPAVPARPSSIPTQMRRLGAVVSGSCAMQLAGKCVVPSPQVGPLQAFETQSRTPMNVCRACLDHLVRSGTWTVVD